jgi:hypothetical protein
VKGTIEKVLQRILKEGVDLQSFKLKEGAIRSILEEELVLQEYKANLTEDVTALRKLLLEAKADLEWFQKHWCESDPSGLRTGLVRVTRLLAAIEAKVPVASVGPLLPNRDEPCDVFQESAYNSFRCAQCGYSMRDHLVSTLKKVKAIQAAGKTFPEGKIK